MNIRDAYNAKAIALVHTEVPSYERMDSTYVIKCY